MDGGGYYAIFDDLQANGSEAKHQTIPGQPRFELMQSRQAMASVQICYDAVYAITGPMANLPGSTKLRRRELRKSYTDENDRVYPLTVWRHRGRKTVRFKQ